VEGEGVVVTPVDLHHLMEKLGAAARIIDGPAVAGEKLRHWKLALLNRRSAATDILEELVLQL
jgi:hypothetical protein